jgi:hypothetical protein
MVLKDTSRRRRKGKPWSSAWIHQLLSLVGFPFSSFCYRLATILKKRSLSPTKMDEIKIKANVLRAFVEKKTEEGKEKVARAESEL